MTSQCPNCSQHAPLKWPGVEILENKGTLEEQEVMKRFLGYQLTVDLGAGRRDTVRFDEANDLYLSRHFPSLDKRAYCCPPVYEYRYPGEPSEIIESADGDSISPSAKVQYSVLKRNRRGEIAEEEIIVKLTAMLKEYDVASFVIHGYNWKAKYLNTILKLNRNLRKLFGRLPIEEGEIDLLISIPGKLLLTIEVKAANDLSAFQHKVAEAVSQSEKTARFLSMVNFDLIDGKIVPIAKCVALPNIDKVMVDRIYCEACSTHIMTKQDLENIADLHKWFTNITTKCAKDIANSQYDYRLHKSIVGRLIGPASLVEVRTIPESIQKTVSQIREEHGTAERIQERWYQLNPEQLSVKFNDPKFLWLTGAPGSGKTVLALWKIQELLREGVNAAHSSEQGGEGAHDGKKKDSVLYAIAGINAKCLQQIFQDRLGNKHHGTCELIITTVLGINETSYLDFCQYFPHFIRSLQDRHPNNIVHVIMDEVTWFLSRVNFGIFKDDWDLVIDHERLGYVWLVQDTVCADWESSNERLPNFDVFHLSYIMRMSKQNVEFVNFLLEEKFRSGHAVSGNHPVMYTMECICLENREQACFSCHNVRVAWLLQQAIVTFQVTRESRSGRELCFEDIALLSMNFEGISNMLKWLQPPVSFTLQKYPEAGSNEMTVCSVDDFHGCEQSIIFADFDAACTVGQSKECLTRSLGQVILLDGGCKPENVRDYSKQRDRVERAACKGELSMEIRRVKPSDEEMKILRKLLINHLNTELQNAERDLESGSLSSKKHRTRKEDLSRQSDALKIWLEDQ